MALGSYFVTVRYYDNDNHNRYDETFEAFSQFVTMDEQIVNVVMLHVTDLAKMEAFFEKFWFTFGLKSV